MKRVLSILLSCLLLVGLFACGNDGSAEETTTDLPTSGTTVSTASSSSSMTRPSRPLETVPTLDESEFDCIRARWSSHDDGVVIDRMDPNVLVVQFASLSFTDSNEERVRFQDVRVYVFTDDPDAVRVGARITVYYTEIYCPHDENQPLRIYAKDICKYSGGLAAGKPIIYLYPETPTDCAVQLSLDGFFTCTYPYYEIDGWQNFTAYPDGTLLFPNGMEYYALYWEGVVYTQWDFSQGWCVPGDQTAEFLEWALAEQGLSPREANEFIIYWLPLMQENAYNVIAFQTDAYTEAARLEITPAPDSVIRVFMAFYPSDHFVTIQPQTFAPLVREGFTVVEWGASQVEAP